MVAVTVSRAHRGGRGGRVAFFTPLTSPSTHDLTASSPVLRVVGVHEFMLTCPFLPFRSLQLYFLNLYSDRDQDQRLTKPIDFFNMMMPFYCLLLSLAQHPRTTLP